MAEKVIFEFRAEETEGGYTFTFRRGEEAFTCACGPDAGRPRRSEAHHHRGRSQHRMRETLDFLERMYDDLYGEERADESEGSDTKE